jgi:hypothetical protein
MNAEEQTPNFEIVFSDVLDDESDPKKLPLLAHYCSLKVLSDILRNEEIWFSNPLFFNDHEELRFGINEGYDLLNFDDELEAKLLSALDGNTESLRRLRKSFDYYLKEFENKHALETFVLCFCKHELGDDDG